MLGLSRRSQQKLVGLHPQLVIFVYELMNEMNTRKANNLNYTDFSVFEGLRTMKRQKELFSKGKSWTLNSNHLIGNAVDIVVYIPAVGVTWDDKKYSTQWNVLLKVAKHVIEKHELQIESGYSLWKMDKPHFQMRKTKTVKGILEYKSNFKYLRKFLY